MLIHSISDPQCRARRNNFVSNVLLIPSLTFNPLLPPTYPERDIRKQRVLTKWIFCAELTRDFLPPFPPSCIATMSFAGAGCGLQTRRRVDLAAVRFGLCGVVSFQDT